MLKKIKNSNSFLGNVLKVTSGTILAQVIGYLALPIITRLYTPEHFGGFGIFMALFGIAAPLMGGKFEVALVLEKDKSQRINLYIFSILLSLFVSLIYFFILIGYRVNIITLFNLTINPNLLLILPTTLLFFGLSQANKFLLISNKSFGKISKSIILEKMVGIGSKLIIGFFNPSSIGLVISDLLSKIATGFYTTFIIIKSKLATSLFTSFNRTKIFELLKKYKKYPTYELASDWFNSISNQIPLLIMAFFFDNIIIGYFVFANSTLKQIITISSKNIGLVYYQKISEIEEKKRKSLTLKLIKNLCKVGVLPFAIIVIGAPEIFSFIFSEKWYNAGVFAQIMTPYFFIIFLLKPVNSLYRVYNYQDKSLLFNIINFIFFCAAVIIGGLMKNDILSIVLITISGVAIYGWIYFWILRKMEIKFFEVVKMFRKYLFISILFLSCPILIKAFSFNEILFLGSLIIFSMGYLLYIYINFRFKTNKFF